MQTPTASESEFPAATRRAGVVAVARSSVCFPVAAVLSGCRAYEIKQHHSTNRAADALQRHGQIEANVPPVGNGDEDHLAHIAWRRGIFEGRDHAHRAGWTWWLHIGKNPFKGSAVDVGACFQGLQMLAVSVLRSLPFSSPCWTEQFFLSSGSEPAVVCNSGVWDEKRVP